MNFSRGFAWLPLLLGVVLAIGVSGAAYWYVHQTPGQPLFINLNPIPVATSTGITQKIPQTVQTNTQTSNSDLQTYTDSQYGFSLQYPNGSKLDTSQKPAFKGMQVVVIGIGEQYVSDSVEVGIDQNTANCTTAYSGSENHPLAAGTTVINGFTFNKYEIDDPAAGLLGLGYVYRAVHNNLCFIITAQYVGAEPSHYQGAERTRVEAENTAGVAQVDAVARSFKFIDSGVSVPGMSKYTDTTFGFTFWYPSTGIVKQIAVPKDYSSGMYGTQTTVVNRISAPDMLIDEVSSPSMSVLSDVDAGCCGSLTNSYFFNPTIHTWMRKSDGGSSGNGQQGTFPADISNNTMGGLHILQGYTRFGAKVIIPLSATHFLAVYSVCNDATDYECSPWSKTAGGYGRFLTSVNTIVATDPLVATPVSVAQQNTIIQAEKDAYVEIIKFQATPTSGNAPLTVHFSAAGLQAGQQYVFDDGLHGPIGYPDIRSTTLSPTAIYTVPGIYTATFGPVNGPRIGSIKISVN